MQNGSQGDGGGSNPPGQAGGPESPEVTLVKAEFRRKLGNALRDVTVQLEGDTIVLGGTTSSFYQKQVAQESIRSALGQGFAIRNTIVVTDKPKS